MSSEAKGTFTACVLNFLQKPQCLHFSQTVQLFSLPDMSQQDMVWQPLETVRRVCDSIRSLMEEYRPATSWQNRCAAFRIPSPFDDPGSNASSTARDHLGSILRQAGIDEAQGTQELLKLLPFAKSHRNQGATCRESWARAASDCPHLKVGRQVVTVLLGITHGTTGLERLFHQIPVHLRQDRAHMLGSTLEELMVANQCHEPEKLAKECQLPDGSVKLQPLTSWMPNVIRKYLAKYGASFRAKKRRKKRRDKGVEKSPTSLRKQRLQRGAPQTEADFLRSRRAVVDKLVQSSAAEKQSFLAKSVFKGFAVPAPHEKEKTEVRPEKRRQVPEAAPDSVSQLAKKPRWGQSAQGAVGKQNALAGQLLWLDAPPDQKVRIRQKGFKLHVCPLEFLKSCFQDFSRRKLAGHVVVAASCAHDSVKLLGLCARLGGAFLTDARSFSSGLPPAGLHFEPTLLQQERTVAVTEAAQTQVPGVCDLLAMAASIPGSKLSLVCPARLAQMQRAYARQHGARSRPWCRMRMLVSDAEYQGLARKERKSQEELLQSNLETFADFMSKMSSSQTCPGVW